MNKRTPINREIVEMRMGKSLSEYLQQCIDTLEKKDGRGLLSGLGELMEDNMKKFVREKLLSETINLLKFYKKYPI